MDDGRFRIGPFGMLALLIIGVLAGVIFTMSKKSPDAARESELPTEVAAAAETPTPPPSPVMGWKLVRTDTIALMPGEIKGIGLKPGADLKAVKVSIHADASVNAGWTDQSWIHSAEFRANVGQYLTCAQVGVIDVESTCPSASFTNPGFIIMDSRTAVGSAIKGALGFVARSSKTLESATTENRVKLDLWQYGCTANCSQ